MSRRLMSASLFAGLVSAAAPLSAHPGHGPDGGSHALTHYATTPDHLLPVVAAAVAGAAVAAGLAWVRRRA